MTVGDLIADVVARLHAAAIPHMVTGSIASSWYGEPRATRDVDMVIDPSPPALDSLVESLSTDGWVSSIGLEGIWSRVDQEPP